MVDFQAVARTNTRYGWHSGKIRAKSIIIDDTLTVYGTMVFGDAATDNLTVNGDLIVADDKKLHFGTGEDISLEYDEDGTDDLRLITAATLGVGAVFTLGTGTATGAGGSFVLTCGAGGATSGAGGAVTLLAGAGSAGTSVGGASSLTAGAGANTTASTGGAGGAASLTSGVGGTESTGTGGAGGAVSITGGAGGATSGAGGIGGAGSSLTLTAGVGGADGEGTSGTGGVGGSITLTPGAGGAGNTTGSVGQIILAGTRPVNANAGGIRTCQSVADVNDTTPTDAELDSAFGSPASLGRGFMGTIDDADGDTNMYLCLTSDASWYFLKFTKAT